MAVVDLTWLSVIAAVIVWQPVQLADLRVFGMLLLFCVAVTELTRRSGEPGGTATDVHAVWCLPAALVLPPLYALLVAIPIQILLQIRVRSALVYRRVFTAAAVGLSYAAASVIFHATAASADASVTGSAPAGVRWVALAAVCGCVQVLVNKTLVLTAAKWSEPAASWRQLIGGREALYNDLAALCLAVVVAWPVARATIMIVFALPLAALLQRSQRHAELTSQARIDAKTGLLNAATWQREAHTEVSRAVRTGAPLAVAMIDIDRFKAVNDTYGHLAGDAVLAALAAAMRSELRDYDLLGRFGGEEFALLLPETSPGEAAQIAERLRAALAAIIVSVATGPQAGPCGLSVTVSIGLAALHASRRDLTDLLAAADSALYEAKQNGRNQIRVLTA